MFQLLNRLSWAVSLLLGLSISFFDNDFIIPGIVLGIILKYILFSPRYIQSRLVFFKNQVLKSHGVNPSATQTEDSTVSSYDTNRIDTQNIAAQDTPSLVFEKQDIPSEVFSEIQEDEQGEKIPAEPNIFQKFFAENIIAKIGAIIVFIGVLFFLSVIYSLIGPVGKIVIGFMIGFSFYAGGVMLDKKGIHGEARIVMGVGILINYLVILSGRFLLGDDSSLDNTLLSAGVTFMLLILNTAFAVVTSLVYKSQTLLVFSFVFAYLNPLLLGTSSQDPYTLLGYTMIVSAGAFYLSYTKKDHVLFILSFTLASILLLIAPWSDANAWISKLLCINLLGAVGLYVSTVFTQKYKFITELLISGIYFLIGIMGFLGIQDLSNMQLGVLGLSSFGLMIFCYTSAKKGSYLYSIGTIGTILTLSPALYANGLDVNTSALSMILVGVFAVLNIGYLLFESKEHISKNIGSIILGLIAGALFLTAMIYFFGSEYFPGLLLGFAYALLAMIYAVLGFIFVQRTGIENIKNHPDATNTFYAISGLAVSLFTLSIAFIFSDTPEVISIIWVLESSILFFLAGRLHSVKVSLAGIILMIIGVLNIFSFFDSTIFGEFALIPVALIIIAALGVNLYFRAFKYPQSPAYTQEIKAAHDIFHFIGIITSLTLIHSVLLNNNLTEILGSYKAWYSLMYYSASLVGLAYLYKKLSLQALTYAIYILLAISFMTHISVLSYESENFNVIYSLIVLLLPVSLFVQEYKKEKRVVSIYELTVFSLYAFIATTLYVDIYVEASFAITMYWGVLAFVIVGLGISKNIRVLRTIGLYFLSLTVLKIFFFDIWQKEMENGLGFLVFIITGVLMIILSTMYTKKFGNTLKDDFSLGNIFPNLSTTETSLPEDTVSSTNNTINLQQTKNTVMQDISSVDIAGIIGVRMIIVGRDKPIQIRAENLVKIAKLIVNSKKKHEFKSGELEGVFQHISADFKSKLTVTQYKKIKDIVQEFVEHGGKIEFVLED